MNPVKHRIDDGLAVTPIEPIFLTLDDAVRCTGLSRAEIYRRAARGQCDLRKLGRKTGMSVVEARRLVESLPPAELGRPALADGLGGNKIKKRPKDSGTAGRSDASL